MKNKIDFGLISSDCLAATISIDNFQKIIINLAAKLQVLVDYGRASLTIISLETNL